RKAISALGDRPEWAHTRAITWRNLGSVLTAQGRYKEALSALKISAKLINRMNQLLLDTDLSPRQREYVGLAQSSAEALLYLINDILDFSKIEAGRFELESLPFSLRDALGDTLLSLASRAAQKALDLNCRIPPNVPDALVGDPHRLRQIVINLVGNAIKFADAGEIDLMVEPAGGTADGEPGNARSATLHNGREAVELSARESFDVVLMDVQMPEIDGLEATKRIRDRQCDGVKRVPIIAMTAHAMKGDREQCLDAGMDAYISPSNGY